MGGVARHRRCAACPGASSATSGSLPHRLLREGFAAGTLALAALASAGPWSPPAQATPASASFQIPRQSIDGGASRSASARYVLRGTLGQPDAAAGGSASLTLRGGFHRSPAGASPDDAIFGDGFEAP